MTVNIVLGIDPGLNSTGWGVVTREGSKLVYIASGHLNINSKDELPLKLHSIYEEIAKIIELYQPTDFAIEETYVNDNAISSLKLGQARGVTILAAVKANLKISEYAPRFIKKAIVGSGAADKTQINSMITRLLNRKISDNNEADALAIAICHLNCSKFYTTIAKS